MNMPLYQLADEFIAIAKALADQEMPEEVIADTLEGASGELEQKAWNIAALILQLDAETAMIKEAEQRMSARRKSLEKRVDWLREYPKIFIDRHAAPTVSGMHWGFCCGDYWFDLIDSLCAEIAVRVAAGTSPPVVATQVKEKYRRLRFHFRRGNDEIKRITQDTSERSEEICDTCGQLTIKHADFPLITCPDCDEGARND